MLKENELKLWRTELLTGAGGPGGSLLWRLNTEAVVWVEAHMHRRRSRTSSECWKVGSM